MNDNEKYRRIEIAFGIASALVVIAGAVLMFASRGHGALIWFGFAAAALGGAGVWAHRRRFRYRPDQVE